MAKSEVLLIIEEKVDLQTGQPPSANGTDLEPSRSEKTVLTRHNMPPK